MKPMVIAWTLSIVMGLSFGCAKKQKFHQTSLPDPQSYVACFREFDTNGDGTATREEFESYFPQAEPRVFGALDLNGDKVIDHSEWHKFEEAHGAKHKGAEPQSKGSKSY